MKILAVDTSTVGCSVCITNGPELIADINLFNKETHSRHLMKLINSLIDVSGISLKDIDGFAFSHGPGSFTGLRIGLSTILGLSTATGKPAIGVSTLEALAHGVCHTGYDICSIIDARKNEVFIANFSINSDKLERIGPERLCNPNQICNSINSKTVFIGTGAKLYRDLIHDSAGTDAVFLHDEHNHVKARTIADLSQDLFLSQEPHSVPSLCYIRKSDAEINRKDS